jgi:hypothetical protein
MFKDAEEAGRARSDEQDEMGPTLQERIDSRITLKTMKVDGFGNKPIADLFQNTTIMFADIKASPLGALQRNHHRCSPPRDDL